MNFGINNVISIDSRKKVFLGGTCNNSTWREQLIPLLKIDYFNPVVKDWTPECQEQELLQREQCDVLLYVITPEMTGFYSIAEVVDDSNKRPAKTLLCVLDNCIFDNDISAQWSDAQKKSIKAVMELVEKNGVRLEYSLNDVANYLNNKL